MGYSGCMKRTTAKTKNQSRNTPFCQFLGTEAAAIELARMKTRAHSFGDRAIFVVTDGPENNWAVMDARSAIELGNGYRWFC